VLEGERGKVLTNKTNLARPGAISRLSLSAIQGCPAAVCQLLCPVEEWGLGATDTDARCSPQLA